MRKVNIGIIIPKMDQLLHNALGIAVRKLLTPLVRILLGAGVPCGVFVEQVKRVYVDVARSDFNLPRRKPSISRAAVLTGLNRKEVSRLWKSQADADEPAIDKYNRAARVISAWLRTERFADARGGPASLPFQLDDSTQGPSFSELVTLYSGDVPARAVLDELLRVGAVEHLKNGNLRLIEHAYVPAKGKEEKLGILGRDVAELLTTLDHNLNAKPEDALFQRKVLYDNLPIECLSGLRERSSVAAQELLENFDRQMSQLDRDETSVNEGTGRATVSIGIYYYEDVSDDGSSAAASRSDGKAGERT